VREGTIAVFQPKHIQIAVFKKVAKINDILLPGGVEEF
jgi:hypothetical protein